MINQEVTPIKILVFFETKFIALYSQLRTYYPPLKNYILLTLLKAVAFEIIFNNFFN